MKRQVDKRLSPSSPPFPLPNPTTTVYSNRD